MNLDYRKTQEMAQSLQVKTAGRSATIRRLSNPGRTKLGISVQGGLVIVPISEILYCEAMSNYCRVYLLNGKSYLVSKTMKRVVSALPAGEFLRTHQSFVVRLDEITQTGQEVTLSNGKTIPLSRSQRATLFTALQSRISII